MSTIRHKDRGVVGALDYYGRGADIRFRLDSFVIIGFLPQKYDYVRQMIGRSSRTLGQHFAKLIAYDKKIPSEAVTDRLEFLNNVKMEDGLDIVKIMRGRRRSNIANDS